MIGLERGATLKRIALISLMGITMALGACGGTSNDAVGPTPVSSSGLQPILDKSHRPHALRISGTPSSSVVAGSAYSFQPTATDVAGTSLTFSISNKPAWATFSASTGLLSGTPAAGAVGSYANVVVSVSDGSTSASLTAFSITVAAALTISGTPSSSVVAGSAYSFQPTTTGGKSLTFSISNKPAWATFDASTGLLSGTPAGTAVGSYSNIAISVSDGSASASLPAFSITVTALTAVTSGVPAPALAVGYTTRTAGPGVIVGTDLYDFTWFSYANPPGSNAQNGDGSLTMIGDYASNAGVATAYPSTVGSPPHGWKGKAFGGGAYVEAVIKFPAFTGPVTTGWPSFWAMNIEGMTAGPWNDWPGQPTGYGHRVEIDGMEFDFTHINQYGVNGWDQWGAPYQTQQSLSVGPSGSPITVTADMSQYQKYAWLWVPATSTTRGYINWYFNDALVYTYSWDQYNPANPPPPILNTSAMSVLDIYHMVPILGNSNTSISMTVLSMSVWQASTAGNLTQ
jgi:hypothetical protein